MTTVTLAATAPTDADVLGVPVFAGLTVPGDASLVDVDHLRARGWEAKVGDTVTLPAPDGRTVIAVGVGRRGGGEGHNRHQLSLASRVSASCSCQRAIAHSRSESRLR